MAKTLGNIYLKHATSPASFTLYVQDDQSQSCLKALSLVLRCHAVLRLVRFVGRFHRRTVVTSRIFFLCLRGLNRLDLVRTGQLLSKPNLKTYNNLSQILKHRGHPEVTENKILMVSQYRLRIYVLCNCRAFICRLQ